MESRGFKLTELTMFVRLASVRLDVKFLVPNRVLTPPLFLRQNLETRYSIEIRHGRILCHVITSYPMMHVLSGQYNLT